MKRTPFAHIFILIAFLVNSFGTVPVAQAQDFVLPKPGVMVHLSPPMNPPMLKGIKVHTDNPFRFDFILDKGDSAQNNDQLKDESSKLIKYFLASLTIPEKDLWVNLSPYEKDRIVPESFGQTEMGRDLLAEDYMLKQITASLIYPEDEIGKKFWKRVYEEAQAKYHTTNIPVNTFNKVWIVPEKAVVYENAKAGTAFVVESKLKVMLEQDYLSLEKHEGSTAPNQGKETNLIGSKIVREIVIPELTKEVNENKNFSHLRQVYNSLILATWYKKKIKDSVLSQVYADKGKVRGVNIDDPQEKEKIYQQYLKAFKKGVYNYIKEESDPVTNEMIPKKYFSGGADLAMIEGHFGVNAFEATADPSQAPTNNPDKDVLVTALANPMGKDGGNNITPPLAKIGMGWRSQNEFDQWVEKKLIDDRREVRREATGVLDALNKLIIQGDQHVDSMEATAVRKVTLTTGQTGYYLRLFNKQAYANIKSSAVQYELKAPNEGNFFYDFFVTESHAGREIFYISEHKVANISLYDPSLSNDKDNMDIPLLIDRLRMKVNEIMDAGIDSLQIPELNEYDDAFIPLGADKSALRLLYQNPIGVHLINRVKNDITLLGRNTFLYTSTKAGNLKGYSKYEEIPTGESFQEDEAITYLMTSIAIGQSSLEMNFAERKRSKAVAQNKSIFENVTQGIEFSDVSRTANLIHELTHIFLFHLNAQQKMIRQRLVSRQRSFIEALKEGDGIGELNVTKQDLNDLIELGVLPEGFDSAMNATSIQTILSRFRVVLDRISFAISRKGRFHLFFTPHESEKDFRSIEPKLQEFIDKEIGSGRDVDLFLEGVIDFEGMLDFMVEHGEKIFKRKIKSVYELKLLLSKEYGGSRNEILPLGNYLNKILLNYINMKERDLNDSEYLEIRHHELQSKPTIDHIDAIDEFLFKNKDRMKQNNGSKKGRLRVKLESFTDFFVWFDMNVNRYFKSSIGALHNSSDRLFPENARPEEVANEVGKAVEERQSVIDQFFNLERVRDEAFYKLIVDSTQRGKVSGVVIRGTYHASNLLPMFRKDFTQKRMEDFTEGMAFDKLSSEAKVQWIRSRPFLIPSLEKMVRLNNGEFFSINKDRYFAAMDLIYDAISILFLDIENDDWMRIFMNRVRALAPDENSTEGVFRILGSIRRASVLVREDLKRRDGNTKPDERFVSLFACFHGLLEAGIIKPEEVQYLFKERPEQYILYSETLSNLSKSLVMSTPVRAKTEVKDRAMTAQQLEKAVHVLNNKNAIPPEELEEARDTIRLILSGAFMAGADDRLTKKAAEAVMANQDIFDKEVQLNCLAIFLKYLPTDQLEFTLNPDNFGKLTQGDWRRFDETLEGSRIIRITNRKYSLKNIRKEDRQAVLNSISGVIPFIEADFDFRNSGENVILSKDNLQDNQPGLFKKYKTRLDDLVALIDKEFEKNGAPSDNTIGIAISAEELQKKGINISQDEFLEILKFMKAKIPDTELEINPTLKDKEWVTTLTLINNRKRLNEESIKESINVIGELESVGFEINRPRAGSRIKFNNGAVLEITLGRVRFKLSPRSRMTLAFELPFTNDNMNLLDIRNESDWESFYPILKEKSLVNSNWHRSDSAMTGASRKEKVDKAQTNLGGIDLTSNKFLQTQNSDQDIKFHLDPAMLEQLKNAPGFTPVIINIQPMLDLRTFLGLKDVKPTQQLASLG